VQKSAGGVGQLEVKEDERRESAGEPVWQKEEKGWERRKRKCPEAFLTLLALYRI
jgi:hypothetical protein